MIDKALAFFNEAWNKIKQGEFFDDDNNQTFDYMIKNLWKTNHHKTIKSDIIKHLPKLLELSNSLETPPPFILILISLRDANINHLLITEAIIDFVKSNASEISTYQILNLLQTMDEKNIPVDNYINAVLNNLKSSMNSDMVEALAHMISLSHPNFIGKFVKKLFSFPDKTMLKNFVNMSGKRGLLELLQITTPAEANKILGR